MKVIERYPAGRLPKDLLGDDIPSDAIVRVTVETEADAGQRAAQVEAIAAVARKLSDAARGRGLSEAKLEREILREINP